MAIYKTTVDERLKIGFAVGDIFTCIERANRILLRAWDDYFSRSEIENIGKDDAERIGDTLYIATDILHEALTEYYMTIGGDDYGGG